MERLKMVTYDRHYAAECCRMAELFLARVQSMVGLYPPGHPAWERVHLDLTWTMMAMPARAHESYRRQVEAGAWVADWRLLRALEGLLPPWGPGDVMTMQDFATILEDARTLVSQGEVDG